MNPPLPQQLAFGRTNSTTVTAWMTLASLHKLPFARKWKLLEFSLHVPNLLRLSTFEVWSVAATVLVHGRGGGFVGQDMHVTSMFSLQIWGLLSCTDAVSLAKCSGSHSTVGTVDGLPGTSLIALSHISLTIMGSLTSKISLWSLASYTLVWVIELWVLCFECNTEINWLQH